MTMIGLRQKVGCPMIPKSLSSGAACSAVVAALLAMAPPATADGGQYVRTQSGRVRCWVTSSGSGTGSNGPVVICEASGPTSPPWDQWENTGFLQAPMETPQIHCTGAVVDAAGKFSFQCGANIGGAHPESDLVLNYGQTYNVQGWTISSSPDGTRFTNGGTGHGMFVSIENTYPF